MISLSKEATGLLGSSHRVVVVGVLTDKRGEAPNLPHDSMAPTPPPLAELAISGGSVTVDYEAAVRRRCTVRLADPTPVLDGRLNVYRTELRLYRGVRLADGTDELVSLGVFGVARIQTVDRGAGPQVEIDGYDRARSIQRPRLTEDYPFGTGFTVHAGIVGLIIVNGAYANPGPLIQFRTTNYFTEDYTTPTADAPAMQPQLWPVGTDRWQAARDLATSVGQILFFDANGIPRCIPVPDWSTASPTWRFAAGDAGTLVEATADSDNERAYNKVLMTGGRLLGVAAPARVLVSDANPASPTYYGGPYGNYPDIVSNGTTVDPAVLTTAATALLRRHLGRVEEVTVTAACNPAIDVGDCVLVEDSPAAVAANYVVTRATIPLEPDQRMQVSCWPKRALS